MHARIDHQDIEVVVAAGVSSVGIVLAFAAMPTLIMRSVPITETASANGLNTLLRAIGTSSASAVLAAIFSALTMEVGGAPIPTFGAYQLVFWLGAAAALMGAAVAAFIVRPTIRAEDVGEVAAEPGLVAAGERGAVKPVGTQHEVLVRGLVKRESGKPIRQAVVTVLHPDGRHVDWGRTDDEGRYVLALPSTGRYLVVASADGWAPQSGLVEIGHGELEPITMMRRLLPASSEIFISRLLSSLMRSRTSFFESALRSASS